MPILSNQPSATLPSPQAVEDNRNLQYVLQLNNALNIVQTIAVINATLSKLGQTSSFNQYKQFITVKNVIQPRYFIQVNSLLDANAVQNRLLPALNEYGEFTSSINAEELKVYFYAADARLFQTTSAVVQLLLPEINPSYFWLPDFYYSNNNPENRVSIITKLKLEKTEYLTQLVRVVDNLLKTPSTFTS